MVHNTARPYLGTHTFLFLFILARFPFQRVLKTAWSSILLKDGYTKAASRIDVWGNLQTLFLTIVLPIFKTRMQLPLGLGMLNSQVAYRTICTNTLWHINQIIMETVCGPAFVALAYYFILFRHSWWLHPYTLVHCKFARGFIMLHTTATKSEHFLQYSSAPRILALYASTLNHVFGQ